MGHHLVSENGDAIFCKTWRFYFLKNRKWHMIPKTSFSISICGNTLWRDAFRTSASLLTPISSYRVRNFVRHVINVWWNCIGASSLLTLSCLLEEECYPLNFIVSQDHIHRYTYTKWGKNTEYEQVLWYASSRNFPIRSPSSIFVSCIGNFILGPPLVGIVVLVGSTGYRLHYFPHLLPSVSCRLFHHSKAHPVRRPYRVI